MLVTEGNRSEPRLLKRLVEAFRTHYDYDVFWYNANLHQMLDELFVGDEIDKDLDFLEHLRSCRTNVSQGDILDKEFSDIFLVFDMDPQDQKYDPDRLMKATEYFNDSTENGKLYINYPMLESFRHFSNLEDLSYLDIMVDMDGIRRYKELVGREGLSALSDISKIDDSTILRITELNLRKANMITGGGRDVPSEVSYEGITQSSILTAQLDTFVGKGLIYILNTCVFNGFEYNPERFYERLAQSNDVEGSLVLDDVDCRTRVKSNYRLRSYNRVLG